jgi:peptidoglycan/LPS O-acetylase OafA/YrhL
MILMGPGLLRFLLALFVVCSHLSNYEIGRPAVLVFFVLSGYWVARVWDEKYQLGGGYFRFLLARFMRLWPAYACVLLGICVLKLVNGASLNTRELYGLLIFGVASSHTDVTGVSWSLDIELQFYTILPALLILMKMLIPSYRKLVALLFVTTLMATIGWVIQLRTGYWTVLCYLPAFCLGSAMWLIKYKASKAAASVSLALFLIVGIVIWNLPATHSLLIKDIPSAFHEDWFGMMWTAILVPFVSWNVSKASNVIDQHLGRYSYSLYIIHWPLVDHFLPVLTQYGAYWDLPRSLSKLIMLGLVLLLTTLFYLVIVSPTNCDPSYFPQTIENRLTIIPTTPKASASLVDMVLTESFARHLRILTRVRIPDTFR